jgi:5-methylcytosine-specific restriction endonuclease McrA
MKMKKCKGCQKSFPVDRHHFYTRKTKNTVSCGPYCIPCEIKYSCDNRRIRQAKAREIKNEIRIKLRTERATAEQLKFEINRAHRQAISEDKQRAIDFLRSITRLHVEALKINAGIDRLSNKEAKKIAYREREIARRKSPEYKEQKKRRNMERRARETPEERETRREKDRKYYYENREYFKSYSSQWQKKNREACARATLRRRAKKYSNDYEIYTTQQVLEMYGSICHLCLEPINLKTSRKIGSLGWEKSLQVDHVVPISKGGPDTLINVRPAHARCNMIRKNKTIEEAKKLLSSILPEDY